MSKKFKDTVVLDYKGEPIKILKPGDTEPVELTLKQIFWVLLNNAPLQTQNDSIQGMRLAQALDTSKDGVIEIEEGVHDWLKPITEKVTPQLFRVNGNLVYKYICEGFEKPHSERSVKAADVTGEVINSAYVKVIGNIIPGT